MARFPIDDNDVVMSFGKYRGQRIMDVPEGYRSWVIGNIAKPCIEKDAILRVRCRKGVTRLLDLIDVRIPKAEVRNCLPVFDRPDNVNPSLFGSFLEFYIKHRLGISVDNKVKEYLCRFELCEPPNGFKLNEGTLRPTKREMRIKRSFDKRDKLPCDICNISFVHSLILGHFDDEEASELFRYVADNERYILEFGESIDTILEPGKVQSTETYNKIAVGSVFGEIDLIYDKAIVDIKCYRTDNPELFIKQVFAYACLHKLRYGSDIRSCKVMNFLTGNLFSIDFNVPNNVIEYTVMKMGSHCKAHTRLFQCWGHFPKVNASDLETK